MSCTCRSKACVMLGKAMLTAVSRGAAMMPRPTITSPTLGRGRLGIAANLSPGPSWPLRFSRRMSMLRSTHSRPLDFRQEPGKEPEQRQEGAQPVDGGDAGDVSELPQGRRAERAEAERN